MNSASAPQPEKAQRVRHSIWVTTALATFVVVFGFVAYMGADRLQSNPRDVLGTAALFATLAALLGARIGWRFARR